MKKDSVMLSRKLYGTYMEEYHFFTSKKYPILCLHTYNEPQSCNKILFSALAYLHTVALV